MNQTDISQLPYRDNVSCVIFKDDKFLLIQLVDWQKNFWKFPQGGIETGETAEDAIQRELSEELGIEKYRIIGVSSHTNKYDWAEESVKLAGFRWRGQIQKFYVIEYLGAEEEIKINREEVRDYKWADLDDLLVSINPGHKDFANYKDSIEKVLAEFKK